MPLWSWLIQVMLHLGRQGFQLITWYLAVLIAATEHRLGVGGGRGGGTVPVRLRRLAVHLGHFGHGVLLLINLVWPTHPVHSHIPWVQWLRGFGTVVCLLPAAQAGSGW